MARKKVRSYLLIALQTKQSTECSSNAINIHEFNLAREFLSCDYLGIEAKVYSDSPVVKILYVKFICGILL